MKTLFTLLVMLLTVTAFAQSNEMKARMEYEDAETAYHNTNYSAAVTHLENAEKLLGKPTGKTRYLLILSLEKDLTNNYDFNKIEKIRRLCKHYLDNYSNDAAKFREIYDLSNSMKQHPKNTEEFNTLVAEINKKNEEKQKIENEKKEKELLANKIKKFRYSLNDIVLGSTYEQIPYDGRVLLSVKNGNEYSRKYKSLGQDDAGVNFVEMSGDKISKIVSISHSGRKKDRTEIYAKVDKVYNELINTIGKENITKVEETNEYWNIVTISTPKNIGYYYEIKFMETIKAFRWVYIYETISLK